MTAHSGWVGAPLCQYSLLCTSAHLTIYWMSYALLILVLYLAPYWCISRSYGHPLVLLSLEMGGLTELGRLKGGQMEW